MEKLSGFQVGQKVSITTDKGVVRGVVSEYYESLLLGVIPAQKENALETTEEVAILPPDPSQNGVEKTRINLAIKVELPSRENQTWMFTSRSGHFKNIKPIIDGESTD